MKKAIIITALLILFCIPAWIADWIPAWMIPVAFATVNVMGVAGIYWDDRNSAEHSEGHDDGNRRA